VNENDPKNVLFISIHGYGLNKDSCWFYPGGGQSSSTELK